MHAVADASPVAKTGTVTRSAPRRAGTHVVVTVAVALVVLSAVFTATGADPVPPAEGTALHGGAATR